MTLFHCIFSPLKNYLKTSHALFYVDLVHLKKVEVINLTEHDVLPCFLSLIFLYYHHWISLFTLSMTVEETPSSNDFVIEAMWVDLKNWNYISISLEDVMSVGKKMLFVPKNVEVAMQRIIQSLTAYFFPWQIVDSWSFNSFFMNHKEWIKPLHNFNTTFCF